MTWTAERVEMLETLWREGHPASQIAEKIGGVTRSAVLGRIHRMGMSGRAERKSDVVPRAMKRKPRKRTLIPRDGSPIRYTKPAKSTRTGMQIPGPSYEPSPPPEPHEFDQARLASGDTVTGVGMLDERPGRPHDCRFPVGSTMTTHIFCAADALPGLLYCEHHLRRAHVALKEVCPIIARGPLGKTIEHERHQHANAVEFLEPA